VGKLEKWESGRLNMAALEKGKDALERLISFKLGDPLHFCLELNPPRGVDISAVINRLRGQLDGISFVNVTDSALARMKAAALPFASIIKRELEVEPLVNLTCRDRNVLALQSDLLGGAMLGVRSIIALTGDALSVGDMPDAKGVFEVNSVGLLGIVQKLNEGLDLAGNPLKGGLGMIPGVVVNPNARNAGAELRRLEKKRAAGAQYALSQPVFDLGAARAFLEQAQASVGLPILLGVMPIRSGKAGLAMSSVPGITLPAELLEECARVGDADFSDRSIERALSICSGVRDLVAGFHVVSGPTPLLGIRLVRLLVEQFSAR
jgi:homocysteine S-methyltransferase